jgi:arylsulfatase A-like enzyme
MILVDDLGHRDLGFSGSNYYETPHLDKLAANSAIFTQGYAGSAVCSPSRATIFTGKFTARHSITDWIGASTGAAWRELNRHDKLLPASYVPHLSHDELTLPETMQANGYKTFFAGKWHLGEEGSFPEDHGFEINLGGWSTGSPEGGYFSPYENPKLPDGPAGENLTMRLAQETATFIKQNKDHPFFAVLSFYAVHGPIQTTQEKWKKYQVKAKSQGIEASGFVMEHKLPIRQTQDNPVYAGLVETMDEAVGLVLGQLELLGLDKNTIVIFTSDNGGVSSGDSFSTSNLPLRGGKGYQWEAGIRVPYLIHIPWLKSKGVEYDYPVTGADFYPTILDYAEIGFMKKQHVDGWSLRPILDKNKALPDRPLYWHYPHYGNQGGDPSSIIREGKWKLIHYYEDNRNELYDMEYDPYEQKNRTGNFPGIANKLSRKLMSWLNDAGALYPVNDTLFDPGKRKAYEEKIVKELLPRLENTRVSMLSDNYSPNADWWGSKVRND